MMSRHPREIGPEMDYAETIHQPDNRIARIEFIPAMRQIGTERPFVVVVLIQLAKQENIDRKSIARIIAQVLISGIAVFMPAPVDNGALNRPHQDMNRQ